MRFIKYVVILITVISIAWYNRNVIKEKYVIHDDVMQAVYWMDSFNDPELFPNDILTDYAAYLHGRNPVYVKVYKILTKFAPPLKIEELLPFLLAPLSMLALYFLFKKKSHILALIVVMLYLILPQTAYDISFGFQKNLALPMYFFLIYFLYNKKSFPAALILLMLALTYPPLFLLSSLFSIVYLIRQKAKYSLRAVSVTIFFSFLLLLLTYKDVIFKAKEYPHLYSKSEILHMPEFQKGGRIDILSQTSFEKTLKAEFGNSRKEKQVNYYLIFVVLMAVFTINNFRKKNPFSNIFLDILIASLILFYLSKLFIPYLYEPARYIHYALPLFFIFNISAFFCSIKKAELRNISVVLLVVFFIIFSKPYRKQAPCVWCIEPELFEYLSSLPKDVTIAAHPYLGSFIPVFAKRKTFVSYELSNPYYRSFYEQIKNRTFDFFAAYYSNDLNLLNDFCRRYSIGYILVNSDDFSIDYLRQGEFYFNPYNEYIKNLVKSQGFALTDKALFNVVFDSGRFYVLKTNI